MSQQESIQGQHSRVQVKEAEFEEQNRLKQVENEQYKDKQAQEDEEEYQNSMNGENVVVISQQTDDQLKKLFDKYDEDKDGQLDNTQVYNLLAEVYKNIYKGSVNKICRKLSLIQNNGQSIKTTHINFNYLQQYYHKLKNGHLFIWKQILQLKSNIFSITNQLKQEEIISKNKPQKIKLQLLVGQQQHDHYQNQISVNLTKKIKNANNSKSKKNQNKMQSSLKTATNPNLQLILTTQNQEKASMIVQQLKKLIPVIKQGLENQNPQFLPIFENLKIDITHQNNKVRLAIECCSSIVNELLGEYNKFFDVICRCQNLVDVGIGLKFDYNLGQFSQNAGKTLDDIICNNFRLNIDLKTSNCIGNWKQCLLITSFFQDLSYDPFDITMLTIMGYLSTQHGSLSLKFKNLGEVAENLETDMFGEIIGLPILNQYITMINDQSLPINMNVILSNLKGPIVLNAEMYQINLKVHIDVLELNEVLTKHIARYKQ